MLKRSECREKIAMYTFMAKAMQSGPEYQQEYAAHLERLCEAYNKELDDAVKRKEPETAPAKRTAYNIHSFNPRNFGWR